MALLSWAKPGAVLGPNRRLLLFVDDGEQCPHHRAVGARAQRMQQPINATAGCCWNHGDRRSTRLRSAVALLAADRFARLA
jgi:hypothetical protein